MLEALTAPLRCPYCGREHSLAPDRRAELERYESNVAGSLARAESERAQAETWSRWYGGRGAQPSGLAVSMVVFGAMFAVLIGLGFVAQLLVTSADPALKSIGNYLIPITAPVVVLGTLVGHTVYYYSGRRRETRAAAVRHAPTKCPRCGAHNALAPGQVLTRCSHCGASLLPTETLMAEGLRAAQAVQQSAELARYRSERTGMAAVMRSSMGNFVPYIVIGSFLPMTLFATLAFTVESVTSGNVEPGLAALWAVAGINVSALVLVVLWRRAAKERVSVAIESASAPFVHREVEGFDGLIGWLNDHWAGRIELTELSAGPQFKAVSMIVGEFVVMLVLNPAQFARGYPGYAAVYFPAWIPSLHPEPGRSPRFDEAIVEPRRAALRELGFGLELGVAGLRAGCTESAARALVRRPDGGAVLTKIATQQLELARALDASPVNLPPSEG